MRAQKRQNSNIRYAALAVSFSVICIAFLVVLAVVKIRGPQTDYMGDDDTITKTVTVSGLRGEIYDRNGKLLVGNATTYDLIYEYGAMPDTHADINRELLEALEALEQTDNEDKLCEDLFPIVGFYPNFIYVSEVNDPSSDHAYYLSKYLASSKLDEDTTALELAEYIMDRHKLDEKKYTAEEISALMRLWYEMDRIGFGAFQFYTIAEDVSMELVTYVQETGIEGANFKTMSTRVYNYPGIASHILGRVGKITAESADHYSELGYPMDAYVGTSGCELAFESILHGQDGTMVIKYDRDGNIVEKYYEKEPISGNDVWLTIDIDLQIAAEKGLEEAARSSKTGDSGAITVLDPKTGAVLAIASYPTYDLTQFSSQDYYNSLLENKNNPLVNRALSGIYAPGSTYKIGVALAALENGTISDPNTSILTVTPELNLACDQKYDRLHGPTCLASHGQANLYEAIQESCNIFFYEVGYQMGITPATRYTQSLGLGVKTGIELGESIGTVAGPQNNAEWNKGNDISAAIGQSDHGYTPLQLSVYTSSIINKGARYNTHLLGSVRNFYTKEVISAYTPSVAENVDFSQSTYDTLMTSMGMVVYNNDEVFKNFENIPDNVKLGGKTGTAEVDGQDDPNALFTGFAMVDGQPELVVSCIIEKGQHGYCASLAAGRVMEEYFKDK
ncbi:MAG: hypothetical protein E7653_02460 [Ruminococcaceae bacterium]|nr:hypothetical protein [Oscillospiraceae bacterium]